MLLDLRPSLALPPPHIAMADPTGDREAARRAGDRVENQLKSQCYDPASLVPPLTPLQSTI